MHNFETHIYQIIWSSFLGALLANTGLLTSLLYHTGHWSPTCRREEDFQTSNVLVTLSLCFFQFFSNLCSYLYL